MNPLFLPTAVLTLVPLLGCTPDTSLSDADVQDESTPRPESQSPLDVVNQRMSAYNRHDLPAFMAVYAEGIEVIGLPTQL